MANLNYAKEYNDSLAQAFPYVLNFGAIYATPNNGRYRFKGGKSIELPVITTTSRTAASRDTTGTLARNYENTWEEKTLTNQRKWSTLVHPQDIDQTNYAASIANITSEFNNTHKFPEMDAYAISKIFTDWVDLNKTPVSATLTTSNVLSTFDSMMSEMTEANIPVNGRILYVTPSVMTLLKNASGIERSFNVKGGGEVNRNITMLDGVQVVVVPTSLMKSSYSFTNGYIPASSAFQIQMFLIHPECVIAPVSYEFSCLDEPSAVTGGKYVYYEESFEDVFILNKRASGINFVIAPVSSGSSSNTGSGS